ncbi:Protein DROOPING LEAF [Linum perenne]
MNMNLNQQEEKVTMDLIPPSDHLCYVRCNFCNTVLAVGIPYKRLMDTVTVKCGHCSNLSFLSTRPPLQGQCLNDHHSHSGGHLSLQEMQPGGGGSTGFCSEFKKLGQPSSSSSSSSTDQPLSPKAPFVVKPPEKKHRLPSAYNRFMREEIQRIKSANPEIPHREAFSAAAKNWARYIPSSTGAAGSSVSGNTTNSGLHFAGMR